MFRIPILHLIGYEKITAIELTPQYIFYWRFAWKVIFIDRPVRKLVISFKFIGHWSNQSIIGGLDSVYVHNNDG